MSPSHARVKPVVRRLACLAAAAMLSHLGRAEVLHGPYVLPILERARVRGFFAGPHHKYERIARAGLRGAMQHIVTVAGGVQGLRVTPENGPARFLPLGESERKGPP